MKTKNKNYLPGLILVMLLLNVYGSKAQNKYSVTDKVFYGTGVWKGKIVAGLVSEKQATAYHTGYVIIFKNSMPFYVRYTQPDEFAKVKVEDSVTLRVLPAMWQRKIFGPKK